LLGGLCLLFTLRHLHVLREMAAHGQPLDRRAIVQGLLWALLTVVLAAVLGVVVLGDLLARRS